MTGNVSSPSLSMINEHELLEDEECILIVDDSLEFTRLVQDFLHKNNLPAVTAHSADALHRQLTMSNVALVLLDIGLPDGDGANLIPELKQRYPDLAVIMLTAVSDVYTALACLRQGADDYLVKPVQFPDLHSALHRVLEKRRLTIRNRHYQRRIEQANFRIQLAHDLALKMNTAYLGTTELDEVLHAILVGITAEEGLGFNRAFLALFDEDGALLKGRSAIGPANREEGSRIWQEIQDQKLGLHDLIARLRDDSNTMNVEVNRIARALQVDALNSEHVLIRAVRERRSINVVNGQSEFSVPLELLGLLQEDTFVVVPLFSPSRALGVIIADHFVSRHPIDEEQIKALEGFASQASLAIEHCRLHTAMQRKMNELEAVAAELQKNKDLLIDAERYSALGHMAAQLAHSIRNPITAIGGTARLLARKIENKEWLRFLSMMAGEAEKIEKILEDLFVFVEQTKPEMERVSLLPLIGQSLLLYYKTLNERGIRQNLVLPEHDLELLIDPRQIQQALVHLFRNSIEAMPLGGELTVSVEVEDKQVRIIIHDTGKGLSRGTVEYATDPFFTTKVVGTGMGLTIVRRIVEEHGGELVLQSSGNGMRATIVLPKPQDELPITNQDAS